MSENKTNEDPKISKPSPQINMQKARVFHEYALPMRLVKAEFPTEGSWFDESEKIVKLLGSGFHRLMEGDRGTQKTLMACKVVLEAIARGGFGKYFTAVEILLKIADSGNHNYSGLEAVDQFITPPLLIIDNMEILKKAGEMDRRYIDHITHKRHESGRDTLTICDLTDEEGDVNPPREWFIDSEIWGPKTPPPESF